MKPSSIPLASIAAFAHEGRVYRSFGRLLAARNGSLLLVPLGLVAGDFSGVRDGCPVPWTEVLAAFKTPLAASAVLLNPEQLVVAAPKVAALFPPYGWSQDSFSPGPGWGLVNRVTSPDGLVFCWVR